MMYGKIAIFCFLLMLAFSPGCSESDGGDSDGDSDSGGEGTPDGDDEADGDSGESSPDGDEETLPDGDTENTADGDGELTEGSEESEDTETSENEEAAEVDIENEIDPDDIGDPDYDQNPASVNLRGACPAGKRIGGFKVEMNEDMGYTAIEGVVRNGVIPKDVPEVAVEDGDCRLLRRRRLVCNPACESGYTCNYDLTCIPSPVGQDAGLVVFRGLSKTVVIGPIYPTNSYSYNKLNHPGFAENTVIKLASTDGYFGEMEMFGVGVSISPK